MTHTPTLWRVGYRGATSTDIDTVNSEFVATCYAYKKGLSKANAARIVAAVNAVEGISNESLEAGAIAELVEAAQFYREQFGMLVNQPFGGELPCSDEEIEKMERAEATLAKLDAQS